MNEVNAKFTTIISAGADLNDYMSSGIYRINANATQVANCPSGYSALIVAGRTASGTHQLIFNNSGICYRSFTGNPAQWSNWYKVTGTVIT